jgi:hypothetical protein
MDGVLHLASPDPPIRSNTPLPVEAACASGQADDRVLLRVDSINKQYADQVVVCTENLNSGVVMMKSAEYRV